MSTLSRQEPTDAVRQQPSSDQLEKRSSADSILLPLAVGLIGLALTGAGVVAIFKVPESAGSATLVVAGVALVTLAAFGHQLGSLKFGKFELVLRRAADEAAARGDLQTAKVLNTAANSVSERRGTAARSYAFLRRTMPAGPERTEEMGEILAEAKRDAASFEVDAEEVLRFLWTGGLEETFCGWYPEFRPPARCSPPSEARLPGF